LIDASDKRLDAWLTQLPPRHELVMRMALNGSREEPWRDWDRRVGALMRVCKIDTTAKMAKLLTDVRKRGEVIEAWMAGDGDHRLNLGGRR